MAVKRVLTNLMYAVRTEQGAVAVQSLALRPVGSAPVLSISVETGLETNDVDVHLNVAWDFCQYFLMRAPCIIMHPKIKLGV